MEEEAILVQFDQFNVPKRDQCLYASHFCEENIWQLCKSIKGEDESKLAPFRVIFISNEDQLVPLWRQKAGSDDEGQVFWDYHVILLRIVDSTSKTSLIYDFDTTLPFPCPFDEYFKSAIRFDDNFIQKYKRKFRLIPAINYIERFSSDRSHMRDDNGRWHVPPPSWPCIQTPQHPNTIAKFWSMDADESYLVDISDILSTRQLYEKFRMVQNDD